MDEAIVTGIDVGTTKTCTLVARVEGERSLRILGVGIEPSLGMRKGTIIDLQAASQSIARSIEKAERTSGIEITSALVSLAGSHITSLNGHGAVGISGHSIDQEDINRALESAQAVAIPHDREIIHVIQRGFTVDGQDGIRMPIGMHAYRMEVSALVVAAVASTVENLRESVQASGVQVSQFVLNPLASGEVVLSETERQMGVVVCDIGGGTTDMAIYMDGDVWYASVIGVGGNHVTSDIAHGLRLSTEQAEDIKKQYGHAIQADVEEGDTFSARLFGEEGATLISRRDLAMIIEARMEEIFDMVLKEIKHSAYDGMLPAGVVLTGGASLLPGIRELAAKVLNLPVRVARPENLVGLSDQLHSPAYSTSVGLLYWGLMMSEPMPTSRGHSRQPSGGGSNASGFWEFLKRWAKRLMP